MSCGCTGPVPSMHVPKEKAYSRRQNFLIHKHPALSRHAGKPEQIFIPYNRNNFLAFLKAVLQTEAIHLRIYFAAKDDLLYLVYAAENKHTGFKQYYQVDENKFNTRTKDEVAPWINAYHTGKKKLLNAQFDMSNDDKGETTAIRFLLEDIQQFHDEIVCQEPLNIRAHFAAYLPKERKYKKKMHVEFVFTRMVGGVEEEFDIEDCENFEDRETIFKKFGVDFNNGTLCPPCTGCDDSGFPPEDCTKKNVPKEKHD